ncbi:MipA/OmpV family protein [Janthinobacterium agaricidamnosum]|nr:MipA/OmpV family protein [Janthinobacterium agaricidamnosum]
MTITTRLRSRLPVLLSLLASAAGAAEQAAPATGNTFIVGGGLATGARYSGSDQNMVAPVIVLDYSTPGGFFASTLRGLGYGSQAGPFSYSAALGYRGERKEKNEKGLFGNSGSSQLKGMGDIKGNASALLGIGYAIVPGLNVSLSTDLPLSQRDNGKTLQAGISGQLYAEGKENISLGLSAGFGDSKYGQTYYGVTARQAANSRFKAYQAGSGLYEVNAMLTWAHQIDARWSVTTIVAANRLVKDAAKSPLAERKTAPTAAVYASYNY